MENILIIGASGHAKVIIDIVEKENRFRIAGLIENTYKKPGLKCCGHEIIGTEESIPVIMKELKVSGGIVAIGDNWNRANVAKAIMKVAPGFRFVSAVHPSAQIARDVTIGDGTVIMAGTVINTATKIGRFCIINTNASVDHDCIMEDYSSIAPGAAIGGTVTIGAFSAISIGANIVHKVKIGEHTVVGAGATVLNDIPPYAVAYGSPSKVIRGRKAGDNYL